MPPKNPEVPARDAGTPPALLLKSSALLRAMYDPAAGQFSYSTRLAGGRYVNDFAHPLRIRYTVNSLAGVQEAQRYHHLGWDLGPALDRYLELRGAETTNIGDQGLLLHVLAVAGHAQTGAWFTRLAAVAGDPARLRALNGQEICWLLSGLVTYARLSGTTEARAAARAVYDCLRGSFMNPDTLLPHYNLDWWRKQYTAFGAVVYFFKVLHEYAQAFNDSGAEKIFRDGVTRVLGLQGRQGEWPWFYNVNVGRVMDWYQIYSVHQDAMALLFLFPACDRGLAGARAAVTKSFKWMYGENEINAPMMQAEPFFINRSLRQAGGNERVRRFLRATAHSARGTSAPHPARGGVEINPECRSYHIGWILYAWAARTDFPEFLHLRGLPAAARS